jgi:hypothetical protein
MFYFGWFIQVITKLCGEHFDVSNHWGVADGHIFDIKDKVDGQMYTVKIMPQIKDWRTT